MNDIYRAIYREPWPLSWGNCPEWRQQMFTPFVRTWSMGHGERDWCILPATGGDRNV